MMPASEERFEFTPAGGGRTMQILADQVACKVAGAATAGAWSLHEVATPPGAAVPFHRHGWEETYYVLEGELEFQLGARAVTAARGAFVRVQPGQPHAMRNASAAPARFLLWASPAGVDGFFGSLESAAREAGFGMERVIEIAGKHGIELVPPPGA